MAESLTHARLFTLLWFFLWTLCTALTLTQGMEPRNAPGSVKGSPEHMNKLRRNVGLWLAFGEKGQPLPNNLTLLIHTSG